MRIIAGRFRSRKLAAGPAPGVRPTSDRLRETLFNILGDRVIESVFLDAYAGVGAIGIEALSRGAATVYFVERSFRAAAAIRKNLEALGLSAGCHVLNLELGAALRLCRGEGVRFHIVYLDPPYRRDDLYLRDLEELGSSDLLVEDPLVVAEHARAATLPERAGRLRRVRVHPQGSSALSFYRMEGE